MKKPLIIFILPLFLSACLTPSPSQKSTLKTAQTGLKKDECREQKAILESFLITGNSIEMSRFLDENMVREIIRPLFGGFDIDSENCSGYTAAMRDEATSLLLSRRDEFRSYLLRICSIPFDDGSHDGGGVSFDQQQNTAAAAALEYIDAPTGECRKKGFGLNNGASPPSSP